MIRFLFYLGLFFLFFLVQTSNFRCFSALNQNFDLLLVLVLCLSLKFSHIRTIVAVFLLGAAMDSVSGGPFGIYSSAYVWIYILIRTLKAFVHLENIVFLVCIGVVAVVVENIFILFVLIMGRGLGAVQYSDFVTMVDQTLLSFIVVPLLVPGIYWLERLVLALAGKVFQQHFGRG